MDQHKTNLEYKVMFMLFIGQSYSRVNMTSQLCAWVVQGNRKYAVCSMQYAAFSTQYAVYSMQHATCSTQFTARSMQHAACNMQYAVCSTQYAVRSTHYAAVMYHNCRNTGDSQTVALPQTAIRLGSPQSETQPMKWKTRTSIVYIYIYNLYSDCLSQEGLRRRRRFFSCELS
jgi:hypothetical protein